MNAMAKTKLKAKPGAWQARPEAGTLGGMRLLMWVAQHLGRKTLRVILYPVSWYFYALRGPERRASRSYLSRVFGRPARELEVVRHFLSFAQITADRFFFLAGRGDEIPVRFEGGAAAQRIVDEGQAGIFLAAHFGSFEAARIIGPQLGGINLRIVLDQKVNRRFIDLMERVSPLEIGKIIDSEQGAVALGLTINSAIKQGDWVGFLADRHRPADRTLAHNFLGAPALFPTGPYEIASVFGAPIVCAFCRLLDDGYEVHCEVLSEGGKPDRNERAAIVERLAGHYVTRLEHHVRAAPYGWFNFFDFWASADA